MLKLHKKNITDCCNDINCVNKQIINSFQDKYGVDNARHIVGVNEKIQQTNLKKYGCVNPFGNKEIQKKIKTTVLNKYGVEHINKNKEFIRKAQQTCLDKYGVINYGIIYSSEHTGDKSPMWKNSISHGRTERKSLEYREWRKAVFQRDLYTCQCCGDKNQKGSGKTVVLNAHHILNYKDNIDNRLDVSNGITLCNKCHNLFHALYGKKNNNQKQFNEFLDKYQLDKNVC